MRATLLPILSLMLLHVTAFAQGDFEEGLRWYNQRTYGSKGLSATAENINRAIPYFEKALENRENELETGIYLMRSYIFQARFVLDDRSDKRKTFQKAKEVGDRLVPNYPLSKELRFEHLSSIGQWGEVMGFLRAAKEGIVDLVKTQMEALIRLDPEFRNGVGERALAVLNLRVPKIPFILSWPDKRRSLIMTSDVVRRYPANVGNNVYHTEALMKNGKDREALTFLNRALSMSPDPDYLLEDRSLHLQAKQMLERIQGR